MKTIFAILLISWIATTASCDVRSETAKREMEKYTSTPAAAATPVPVASPVEIADVVKVDTSVEGEKISIDGNGQKKSVACTKYNRLVVNGDKNTITVTGVCAQIMINGDENELGVDATAEFVLNGSRNVMRYARFPNGNRPVIVENQAGNTVENVAAATQELPRRRSTK